MKATELHARLGGTLHTLSTASWALHVARWRPSTPARFDAEWNMHPAERREVVVFNRRCYENRYSRAFGDQSYAYAGQVAQASPIEATAPCGELLLMKKEKGNQHLAKDKGSSRTQRNTI